MNSLSRRQALVGTGAVVAAAALPSLSGTIPPLKTCILTLDTLGAFWGVARYGMTENGVMVVPIESDASYRERISSVILQHWKILVKKLQTIGY